MLSIQPKRPKPAGEEKTDETCTCETVPDEKFETEAAETTVKVRFTEDQEISYSAMAGPVRGTGTK